MIELTFLSARVPLTKTIRRNTNGIIDKGSYPENIALFTSNTIACNDVHDMFVAIRDASNDPKRPCIIKGKLKQPLNNERRKGMTSPKDDTQYVCFDLDSAPFSTVEEFVRTIGFGDVSYIIQYSASYKVDPNNKNMNAHVFFALDKPISTGQLKQYTTALNFNLPAVEKTLHLTEGREHIHFPIDPTCAQNDKLIYISEPTFVGMKSPIKDRVVFVQKKNLAIPVASILNGLKAPEEFKKIVNTKKNALRRALGLDALKKTKMIGEYEVQAGVGEFARWNIHSDDGEYVRYNANEGTTGAYWRFANDIEFLHSFKTGLTLLIKEVMPDHYKELRGQANFEPINEPQRDSPIIPLAFRDKYDACYYKGTWDADKWELDLQQVKSKDQLFDWLQEQGRPPVAFVEERALIFNPQCGDIIDLDARTINTFVAPPLLRDNLHFATIREENPRDFTWLQKECPETWRLLTHVVTSNEETLESFLNWLSCITQYKCKTEVSWILHGIEGTGKGTLKQLLNVIFTKYLSVINAENLKKEFNVWMERALLVFVDEIEQDTFVGSTRDSALRQYITDSPIPIEGKGKNIVSVPNYSNFLFAANKPAIKLPRTDRRFQIAEFQTRRFEQTDARKAQLLAEAPKFAEYLYTRTADTNEARVILDTVDRRQLKLQSISSVDQFADALLAGRLYELFDWLPDQRLMDEHGIIDLPAQAYTSLLRRFHNERTSVISRDELMMMFKHAIDKKIPDSPNKFTTYVRHHGINLTRLRQPNDQLVQGIKITWQVTQEEMDIMIGHFKPSSSNVVPIKEKANVTKGRTGKTRSSGDKD